MIRIIMMFPAVRVVGTWKYESKKKKQKKKTRMQIKTQIKMQICFVFQNLGIMSSLNAWLWQGCCQALKSPLG